MAIGRKDGLSNANVRAFAGKNAGATAKLVSGLTLRWILPGHGRRVPHRGGGGTLTRKALLGTKADGNPDRLKSNSKEASAA